jgi:Tol biopolymer transport system component
MKRLVALVGATAVATVPGSAKSAPGTGWISFWGDRGGLPAVWVMRDDGSGRRLVTTGPMNAKRGELSPDGRLVAFDGASKPTRTLSEFDIHVIGVDGRGRRDLTRGPSRDVEAHWSPDGRTLVFQRRSGEFGAWSLWRIGADGRGLRRLTAGHSAAWSADGRTIAFSRRGPNGVEMFAMRADGTGVRPLLRAPGDDFPAAWARDGRLLFTRLAADRPQADVFVRHGDGRVVRLTHGKGLRYAADWSPDGTRVLYTRVVTGSSAENGDVFVMDDDGRNPRNLSRNRWDENATSWR